MQALRQRWPATVYKPGDQAPPLPALNGSVLDRVGTRKTLRVAYVPDSLPYVLLQHATAIWLASTWRWRNSSPGIWTCALSSLPIARPATAGQHRPRGVRPRDDGRGGRGRSRDAVSLLDALPG